MDLEPFKDKAAKAALASVRSGMKLGLGTGSTVAWFLRHLAAALATGKLEEVAGVPTSEHTARYCREHGIPLLELEASPDLDLAVDGADEVDPSLDLIKGLGGALLREKMVARAARRLLVIADVTKNVGRLGEKSPLPVEVVPFAWRWHVGFLESFGARPELRRDAQGRPFETDNRNLILDCRFPSGIQDPHGLAAVLAERPGIVEHGLFLGDCQEVFLAGPQGVVTRSRTAGP